MTSVWVLLDPEPEPLPDPTGGFDRYATVTAQLSGPGPEGVNVPVNEYVVGTHVWDPDMQATSAGSTGSDGRLSVHLVQFSERLRIVSLSTAVAGVNTMAGVVPDCPITTLPALAEPGYDIVRCSVSESVKLPTHAAITTAPTMPTASSRFVFLTSTGSPSTRGKSIP